MPAAERRATLPGSGTNFRLLDGTLDQLAMLLGIQTLADDPACSHHRQVRDLQPQVLYRLLALLLDLGTGLRDQRLGLLARLGLELFAQVLGLFGDPIEHRLRLTTCFLELRLAFTLGFLELPLGAFGRLDALRDPRPALVQNPQKGAPREAVEDAQHDKKDQ